MAIKKQTKRPLDDAAAKKQPQSPPKKQKLEKPVPVGNNGVAPKKAQKADKQKKEVKDIVATKGIKAPSADAANPKKLKRLAQLAQKNENRKEARQAKGQYKPDQLKLDDAQLQLRIDTILSRPDLTRTAKRKLATYRKRLAILKAEGSSEVVLKAGSIVQSDVQKAAAAAAQPKNAKPAKAAKPQQAKGKGGKKPVVEKVEPEDSEDEEEEDDSSEEIDTSAASFMNTTAEDSDEEEDDDEDDDDDEEEDEEEEASSPPPKGKKDQKVKPATEKKPIAKKDNAKSAVENGKAANGDAHDGKKKRYVLFVGNLSFESTAAEIEKHFLTKVSEILSVRVPTRPGSTSSRGFAYVEVTNPTDYEKALSLHNTDLNGRRLKVEYTQGGSKSAGNRPDVVSKNKKLHAMRKQGMLAGSRKEGNTRNDRRQKARQHGPA